MEKKTYRNSLNYIPIDVAKGIDRNSNKRVNADDIDPNYERMPKCRYCKNFTLNTEKIELGSCQINGQKFIAYPDMSAVCCDNYQEE